MKKRIFFLIMLSISLIACGDKKVVDYELKDNYSANTEISFTTEINQRNDDSNKSFADGDQIAVFGLIYNGNTPEAFDINKIYIANAIYALGNGSFTRSLPQRFFGEKMDFIAYTPYLSEIKSDKPEYTIASNQSSGYEQYDIMYAAKRSCFPSDMPEQIKFSHIFSKMEFTLTKGSSISTLEGLTIKVKNLVNTVELNLLDGTLTPKASAEYMIPYQSANDKYEMIVAPQNIAAQTELFEFALNGESITWKTTTPINLTASTLVRVSVTVESNYVDVAISGGIDGWEDDNDPINGTIK